MLNLPSSVRIKLACQPKIKRDICESRLVLMIPDKSSKNLPDIIYHSLLINLFNLLAVSYIPARFKMLIPK